MQVKWQMSFPTRWGGWEAQHEVEERWCERISWNFLKKESIQLSVCLKTLIGENLFYGKKGPSRGIIQKCVPHERSPCAPRFEERSQDETSHPERCARRVAWDLGEKCLQAQKIRIKLCFSILLKPGATPAPISKSLKEASIRNRLVERRCTCWAKKRFKLRRSGNSPKIQEHHNNGDGQWRSANERGSAEYVHWPLLFGDGAVARRHVCRPVTWKTLRRTRILPWVGQRSKTTVDQNKGRKIDVKRKISYLWLSLDCRPILVRVYPLHRHRRTRHRQVQQQSDGTNPHQETWAIHQKIKTEIERGIAIEIRTTVCEIFWNGWRSSQKISKTQECQQPRTFLRTQIRNVLQKWYPGSTVSKLTYQKIEIAKYAREPRWQALLAEDALAKPYLKQKSLVTW